MAFASFKALFFSGTGNSRRVAQWLKDGAESHNIHAECLPLIETVLPPDSLNETTLVGLTFPTHGFTAPWAVIQGACHLPPGHGASAVVVPTRGAFPLSKIKIPGMEGTAGYLIALILRLKGYRPKGVMAVDMPVSWTAVHPGLSLHKVEPIMESAEKKTRRFMREIASDRTYFSGWLCLLLGILLLPLTMLYLAMGRFILAKLFFANYHCVACGLCAKICPVKAIEMRGGRPYWTFRCESCMRCMNFCPEKAVEASHSFGVILTYVMLIPVATYLLNYSGKQLGLNFSPAVEWLVQYLYCIMAFFVSYVLLFSLLKIKAVNIFFTYTTLTHWFTRYRAPKIKIEDLFYDKTNSEK